MFSQFTDPNAQTPDWVYEAGRSWKMTLGMGVITVILGILILFRPDASLWVLAVLIGIEFFLHGLFRLIHAVSDRESQDRVLWVILGIVLMLVGLYLIRHLAVTLLLVSALLGVFWIVIGITELSLAFSSARGTDRAWLLVMGLLGVIAGIVVLAYPVGSLLTLALIAGIWFIIYGVMQIASAWMVREAASRP